MGIFDFFKKNKNIENDNGLNETYYYNGQLKSESNIKDDQLISMKCWDEDGNEIDCEE